MPPQATPASSLTARLAMARDVARDLLATLDRGALAQAALVHLARLVASDGASVVVTSDGGAMTTLAGAPVALRGPLDALRTERGERAFLFCTDARTPVPDALDGVLDGATDAIVAPLTRRGHTFGAVVVVRRSGEPFHPDDVAAVDEVAAPLAIALENARLHATLEKSFTSLRTAQEELVRRERLAAIGTMAAVLAHEVRTPLAVLFNAVAGLTRMSHAHPEAATLVRIMDDETRRLERLVEDLLEVGRPPRSPVEVDAWELLASAVAGATATLRTCDRVDVRLGERAGELPVCWDVHGVRQAVVNLVTNAVQAIDGASGEGRVEVRAQADAGDRVRLTVEDDGPGIPPDVRARIFEPFVTTRARGVGLGLTVVRRAVDDHGGDLFVTSRPGSGTRFDLVLPRRPPPG